MPDVHWGYGFPIGGVAATDVEAGGVVSPGGVGFDISCGVRLLRAPLDRAELEPHRAALMDELGRLVPKGMGRGAVWEVGSERELHRMLARGRQLACVPVRSPEGGAYLAAMAAAAKHGRANRQLLAVAARRVFATVVGADRLELVYDVSHNLAKLEHHDVGGRSRLLCVHRKGATRALPPGYPDLPADLAAVGQPVLVPGSMGTASHVLVGLTGGGRSTRPATGPAGR